MGKDIYLLFDKNNKSSVKKADALMEIVPIDVVVYYCSTPDKWKIIENVSHPSLILFPDTLSYSNFMTINRSVNFKKLEHKLIIAGRQNNEVIKTANGSLNENVFLVNNKAAIAKKMTALLNDNTDTETLIDVNKANFEKEKAAKKAEKALRKTFKELHLKNLELEKINFELDRFVYSVSHDLRAPLTSVLGLIHLLREEVVGSNPQHYIALMIESIAKLDNTIKDILAYSRNNRLQIIKEEFNLRNTVNSILDNLSYLNEPDFDVRKIAVVKGKLLIKADKIRLNTILNNLLSNAIKYRNTSRALKVEITCTVNKSFIKIRVKDNGVGIEPRHLPYVFDMFYRTDERNTGSGLGLYIVKETVLKLKGKVSVNAIVGTGTEIEISIPV